MLWLCDFDAVTLYHVKMLWLCDFDAVTLYHVKMLWLCDFDAVTLYHVIVNFQINILDSTERFLQSHEQDVE